MRAQYFARKADEPNPFGNPWVEALEYEPDGARFRILDSAPTDQERILIEDDGTATYDETRVEIDVYEKTE